MLVWISKGKGHCLPSQAAFPEQLIETVPWSSFRFPSACGRLSDYLVMVVMASHAICSMYLYGVWGLVATFFLAAVFVVSHILF